MVMGFSLLDDPITIKRKVCCLRRYVMYAEAYIFMRQEGGSSGGQDK